MNRRQFIAGMVTSSTTLLAGCSGGDPDEDDTDKSVPIPALDESLLEGWAQDGDTWTKKYYDKHKIQAIGRGVRYKNTTLSERVEKETLGRVENQTLAQLFAVRIDFFPSFAHVASILKDIESQAKDEFESELRNQNVLTGITEQGEVESIQSRFGKKIALHGYSAKYTVDKIAIEDVEIPEIGTRSFVIPEQQLDIQGLIGQWKHNGSIYIAGGVYPNQDFMVRPRTSITGEKRSGIDLVIDVNIDLDSVGHEIRQLIKSVQ